ncbi:Gfo/Idh/MocA family oxidoreductase [Actinosynnema sp. NPDC047251]|uniref:Putative oxidoreductase n=1 Tax=Saccharothrix espanaensis (strain ATCC 51144 / DSM 44229 / JCM 9112 / NBRC 15066 / NRRL 15764) TaxID=1179773 RepID=K0K507_SACES|nr:Gfo/Idh/MocA family oxidoreductase [Saccharothrix espanaensis]CCH33396.1 putative oxidoreductase [Saccharothrix espanaensis DSM 44229]
MSPSPVPVGVIGLGDIARKAYLPVLCALPGLVPHLMTRSRDTVDRIGDAYRVPDRHTTLDGLIEAGVRAAFVHAPTERHHGIVTRLLDAGVDVFVDKPLSYSLAESRELVALARERGRCLAVGFNRRFAPAYVAALEHPRDLVLLQKDRRDDAGDVRTVVLDDFIHLVDTLRMLAPATADDVRVRGSVVDGRLHHVVLDLDGPGFTGTAVMNRLGGTADEVLQTAGANSRREVVNLTRVVENGVPQRTDDWASTGRRRGFEAMCEHFLDAVRSGRRLDAGDALATHELCERIIAELSEGTA